MNPAHLHLLLNHLPIVGVLGGALLLAWGLLRNEDAVTRAALGALCLAGAAAVGVYFTGEPAEEMVESLAGVSEAALEAHEEAALWAAVGGGVLAVLAGLALAAARSRAAARRVGVGVLAVAAVALGAMGWTANLGGQIRHSELRPEAAATGGGPAVEEGAREEEAGREEHGETGLR